MEPHPSARPPLAAPTLVAFTIFALLSVGGCSLPAPTAYHIDAGLKVDSPRFTQVMGNLLGPPLMPGNACVTYENGDQIFPAMLDAVRSAKQTITFESFIYWSGATGQQFTDALAERRGPGCAFI